MSFIRSEQLDLLVRGSLCRPIILCAGGCACVCVRACVRACVCVCVCVLAVTVIWYYTLNPGGIPL
jgi:hypothetical protein